MSRSSPTPAVDFYASLSHYADHLVPIWDAIAGERGTFWCQPRVVPRLRELGIPVRQGRPGAQRRLVVVAGASDAWLVRGHPSVLVEHGAGQAYDVDDPGWSGGSKRDSVVLFLCPNEMSAQRNRAAYSAPAEVVGSPRVDRLRCHEGPKAFGHDVTVALSFHHMGNGKAPECGWALPHYEEALPAAVAELRTAGREVIGHGHPRASRHFRRLWGRLGVEYVEQFDDVVNRAGVYVCDNSSTLFEFAALGRPVVVLNAPWYRRDVDLWPRFWRCADVGVQVDRPEDLAVAVSLAIEDRPAQAERRCGAVAEVYPLLDGQAAQRSAEAILRVAASVP